VCDVVTIVLSLWYCFVHRLVNKNFVVSLKNAMMTASSIPIIVKVYVNYIY
jgi:hypothetical protein